MRNRLFRSSFKAAIPALVSLGALAAFGGPQAAYAAAPAANPSAADVSAEIARDAQVYRIPEVLLDGLAWRESGWRQWDANGAAIESAKNHVGLLGVWAGGRADADRLRNDWRYNVVEGARQLQACWFKAPIIGDRHLEDSRDILESWYYALGRYGDGAQNDDSLHFADTVMDALATGGDGHYPAVLVSRLERKTAATWSNVFPPVPWHFGGVAPRQPARIVVSMPVPYLSQVYDSPDNFNGGGSCGPTSMTMVLAYYHKVQPEPILVTDGYRHMTDYGALIPAINHAVCEPNVGAVHAKMLDYLRPQFPGVAIFYNEKATPELVKHELDAGRPVILGTEVTSAGHIMVARGYLSDGRLLVNDPAGDYYQVGRRKGPDGPDAGGARRYCNGDGSKAVYDWDALSVRWVMTFAPKGAAAAGDKAEDE